MSYSHNDVLHILELSTELSFWESDFCPVLEEDRILSRDCARDIKYYLDEMIRHRVSVRVVVDFVMAVRGMISPKTSRDVQQVVLNITVKFHNVRGLSPKSLAFFRKESKGSAGRVTYMWNMQAVADGWVDTGWRAYLGSTQY